MDSSSNPFLTTLRFPLKPSEKVYKVLIIMHIFSLLMPWLSALETLYKILFTLMVFASLGCFLFKRYFPENKKNVVELILNAENEWQVKLGNGQTYSATPGKTCFVHPLLTVFSLHFDNTSRSFIFTPENTHADDFRRLRVRLRFSVA